MADVVIVNKTMSIERCLKRIQEDFVGYEEDFETNFMRQDAILLNLQRACELSIDLSNYLIKIRKLGVPKNSRNAFELLAENGLIDTTLSKSLIGMVGFRNIAVHDYAHLDLAVVKSIIERRLDDFRQFIKTMLQYV